MFGYGPLVDARETAAVLSLMRRRDSTVPLNQLAGAIEDAGSALAFLAEVECSAPGQLFSSVSADAGLDELEEQVHRWVASASVSLTIRMGTLGEFCKSGGSQATCSRNNFVLALVSSRTKRGARTP